MIITKLALSRQFHFPSCHIRIFCSFRTNSQFTLNPQYEFIAQGFGTGKHIGFIGVEYNLQKSFLIAQVDKDNATVIAPAINPTTGTYLVIEMLAVEFTAIMRAHRDWSKNRELKMVSAAKPVDC